MTHAFVSRWWFQRHVVFACFLGNIPFKAYFSDALKPVSRLYSHAGEISYKSYKVKFRIKQSYLVIVQFHTYSIIGLVFNFLLPICSMYGISTIYHEFKPNLMYARWWFQIFVIFTPILGEIMQSDEHIFKMG